MKKILVLASIIFIFWGCKKGDFVLYQEGSQIKDDSLKITSVAVTQDDLVINGSALDTVTQVKIVSKSGVEKGFRIHSSTPGLLVGKALGGSILPVNAALDLIISSAHGQASFPITFLIQSNAVGSDQLKDDSVTTEKIADDAVTRSKLAPEIGEYPRDGQILKWDESTRKFIFANDLTSGGGEGGTGPGGSYDQLKLGKGMQGEDNLVRDSFELAVNIGTTGHNSMTYIPYFNGLNELELDSKINDTRLLFSGDNQSFYFYNSDNKLKIVSKENSNELMNFGPNKTFVKSDLDVDGDLSVMGNKVCLEDGSNCPGAAGVVLSGNAPVLVSGSGGSFTISLDSGTTAGKAVVLQGTGELPAVSGRNLRDVVKNVNTDGSLAVTNSNGIIGLGVRLGPTGTVQKWHKNLDDISLLSPNADTVLVGNGSSFGLKDAKSFQEIINLEVGVDVQQYNYKLQQLADSNFSDGSFVGTDGVNFIEKRIPFCESYEILRVDRTGFSCSSINANDINTSGASEGDVLTVKSGKPEWVSMGSSAGYPGQIIAFAGPNCPSGTLLADGRSVSKSTYSRLYSAIGNYWGAETSSAFKIPDLRGQFLRGLDSSGGIDPDRSGATVGSFQDENVISHNHVYNQYRNIIRDNHSDCRNSASGFTDSCNGGSDIKDDVTMPKFGGNETRPKNKAVNYCVVTGLA
jgi:hypothetical protein